MLKYFKKFECIYLHNEELSQLFLLPTCALFVEMLLPEVNVFTFNKLIFSIILTFDNTHIYTTSSKIIELRQVKAK